MVDAKLTDLPRPEPLRLRLAEVMLWNGFDPHGSLRSYETSSIMS